MRPWQALSRRRNIPEVPAWLAAVILLVVAAGAGWVAIRPEEPALAAIREPADLLRDSRASIALGEAVLQAVRDDDRRRLENLKAELEARARRESEREDERAAAARTARAWCGVIAVLTFGVGAWLLVATRDPGPP